MNETLQQLLVLYRRYRLSRPSGTKSDKSKFFVPDDYDSLPNEALMFAEPRPTARIRLEQFFKSAVANGSITWQWGAMWFKDFASEGEPKLVLRREWFNN